MKVKPDCIVCIFKQALNTARLVSNDPRVHFRVLKELSKRMAAFSTRDTPAGVSQHAYEVVGRVTGVKDPYAAARKRDNKAAMRILPRIRRVIAAAADPLDAALRAAVAGNMIDLGIGHKFDISRDIFEIMRRKLPRNDIESFRKELRPGRRLLYLGDNAGEIVFDMPLVEMARDAGVEVVFTVKSGPIINDATIEDAKACGMTRIARVVETGSNDIGVRWRNASPAFRREFRRADAILAKGHGNFETCVGRPENIYFLLKAKCLLVASELGVNLGDIVFTRA